jgi:RNA polymerase sigma-70 factor (ECF subfamily)
MVPANNKPPSLSRAAVTVSLREYPPSWLYRIATNVCLNIIRTRTRKGLVLADVLERSGEDAADPTHLIHMRRVLGDVMDQLDARTMEILIAHYFDGMNQGEIAQQIGISRRAMVKRLTALRSKVEDALGSGATT